MALGETGAAIAPLKAVALLGCCSVLLLGRGVHGDKGLPKNTRTPGSKDYCVELAGLSASEGSLTPLFNGEHTKYDLVVENSQSKGVIFTIGLHLQKYNLQHTPVIMVDGEKLEYIPTEAISVRIPLDEDIGAYDKVIPIVVKDPKEGSWFHHTNSKTYHVHIRQPPEFDKVTEAKSIKLYGGGQEIKAEPEFDPNSTLTDYFYNVSTWQTSVELDFQCNLHATKMMVDGVWQPVKKHVEDEKKETPGLMKKTIDLSNRVLQRVSATCGYHHDEWKNNERDYLLTIARDLRMTDKTKVDVKFMPDTGFCMPRREYLKTVRHEELPKGVPSGFVCLTDRDVPKIVADVNEKHANLMLRSADLTYQGRLERLVPALIYGAKSRPSEYTLVVTLGSDKREFPVEILFPAPCLTMQCPRHHSPKYIPPEAPMTKKLCLGRQCTQEADKETCCDTLASCNTMDCPNQKNSTHYFCAGTHCNKEDDFLHCCKHWQRCLSFDCPYGYRQRQDAAKTYCKEKNCQATDMKTCCTKQASCEDQTCPAGSTFAAGKNYTSDQHCGWDSCSHEDATHCCEPVADCIKFKCPAGFKRRKDADKLTCYTKPCVQTDATRCCVPLHKFDDDTGGIVELKGRVKEVNEDGTYVVVFMDNTSEMAVPEWSIHNPETMKLTVRPGENVSVYKDKEGNYLTHTPWSGWVHRVHTDGTYLIHFVNDDWADRIPQWAVRAVDKDGNRFVYTTAAFIGQLVYVGRTKSGAFKSVETAIAQVEAVNDDKTYNVTFASGKKDEHVPLWDLRLVDDYGVSHVRKRYEVNDVVEVDLYDLKLKNKFDTSHRHDMMLRTKYLFGTVSGVRPNNLYRITYDFGETEDNVPLWAIRALNDKGEGQVKDALAIRERVEARVGLSVGDRLQKEGIASLGIAVREKLHHYKGAGCWPQAQECEEQRDEAPLIDKVGVQLPHLPDYDAVKNPDGLHLCYYDEICTKNTWESGCNQSHLNCRKCGFDGNPACPKAFDCHGSLEDHRKWSKEHQDWCCAKYSIGCPYVCRFGKWWPDEAKAWGPWWSAEKRDWCCKHHNLGCPRPDLGSLFTTTPQTTGTTSAPPTVCNDGFEAVPIDPGDCPEEHNAFYLRPCNTAPVGSLCKGGPLCGDLHLDNCGKADVYMKKVRRCPNDEGISGFRYSHPGYWATGAVFSGQTASVTECAKICHNNSGCVAFSRHQFLKNCFTYAELGQRVLGSPSDAYMKCDDSERDSEDDADEEGKSSEEEGESSEDTVDLQVKFGPSGSSEPRAQWHDLRGQPGSASTWMTLLLASSAGATVSALLCWGFRMRHAGDLRISQRAVLIPSCFSDGSNARSELTSVLCGNEEGRVWREGVPDELSHAVKLQTLREDDL